MTAIEILVPGDVVLAAGGYALPLPLPSGNTGGSPAAGYIDSFVELPSEFGSPGYASLGGTTMPVPRIDLYAGNVRNISFRLRKAGSPTPWDVAAATAITLEWESEQEEVQTPIPCSPGATGADWAHGIVVVDATNVCAAEPGTYKFSLTLLIGGATITVATGHLELQHRPGFTPA